jgi:hypothetical protein
MDSMKPALALFAGLLFQAAPTMEPRTPFDGGGVVISTLFTGHRLATANPERAFRSESGTRKWLEIPEGLNKALQIETFGWIKGIEKNGILWVSEAVGFPAESLLRVSWTARTADCVVSTDGVGGVSNHMPPRVTGFGRLWFWGGLKVRNSGVAPVKVELQRIFHSEILSLLGSLATKITAKISKEGALLPLPCDVEPGMEQRIALVCPKSTDDLHGNSKLSVTMILSVAGERLFVRCWGEFRLCW